MNICEYMWIELQIWSKWFYRKVDDYLYPPCKECGIKSK